MKSKFRVLSVALATVAGFQSVLAGEAIISGELTGNEAVVPGPPDICGANSGYPHTLVGPIQVDTSGTYYVVDGAFFFFANDVTTTVYAGNYNSNNPGMNRIAQLDDVNSVALNAGTEYFLVVQPWCGDSPTLYATTISGPGTISGDAVLAPRPYMTGRFSNSDPVADISEFQCGETVYDVSQPFQVDRSGLHFFVDSANFMSNEGAPYVDSSATFYDGPFNANNPSVNRIGSLDDVDAIMLQTGVNYRVVTQPFCDNQADRGDWFFLLLPPTALALNHGLSGAWFNQNTSGQGILMEIYEQLRFVFLAWFTYDTSQPPDDAQAQVGNPGHRWLTAQGNYQEGAVSADLTAFVSSGGIFDSAVEVDTVEEGTINIEFSDCRNGMVSYDLTAAGVSGNFPIIRIAEDNADQCEEASARPDVYQP